MPKSIPCTWTIRLFFVGQISLFPVANVKQVAQEAHTFTLYPVSHECRRRNIKEFAHQIQQRSFYGSNDMHAGSQVKRLKSSHVVLDVSVKPFAYLVQRILVVRYPCAYNEVLDVFECFRDLLASGNFSAAEIAGTVLEYHDIACEVWGMCSG